MTDFAHVGSLGTASEYDFVKRYLELSPSSDVPAGDLVVVFAAWTSHYFFGPDGLQTPEVSCTDDAGNRYVQLVSSYVSGPADHAPWIGIFASQLRNDLATSNTLRLKHYGYGSKAVSLEHFSLTPALRWALDLDRIAARTDADGTDPGALTYSGLDPNREYLLLHVLGSYGQGSDSFSSWDSDYSQIAGAGTSGHGNADSVPPTGDVQIRGGWRIATGLSSDTVDVTASGTTRDTAQAVVALAVIDPDEDFPDFPNTPEIDNFGRADEDPLDVASSGALWNKTGAHPQFGSAYARVVSNQAARSSSGSGGGSEEMQEVYESDEGLGEMEIWGTIAVSGDVVLAFGEGDGNAATRGALGVGYRDDGLRAFAADTVAVGANLFGDSGFTGELAGSGGEAIVWGPDASGTKIGMQQLNYDTWIQHLWMDLGSGWEWIAATIRSRGPSFVADGSFSIAFEGDTATRLDDFGGGLLEREAPQIIRRPGPGGGSDL